MDRPHFDIREFHVDLATWRIPILQVLFIFCIVIIYLFVNPSGAPMVPCTIAQKRQRG